MINFFGNSCSKILRLDLQNFLIIDSDIEKLSVSFINLNHLLLKNAKISDDCAPYFEKMKSLTSLNLAWCIQIKDFSVLESLITLTSLNLLGCTKIKDFSVLESLITLTSIDLRSSFPDRIIVQALLDRGVNVLW